MKRILVILVVVSLLFSLLESVFGLAMVTDAASEDDVAQVVNSQTYTFGSMEPAMTAFRLAAADQGWSEYDIEAWAPFVYDIIVKESGGCPNIKGGTLFNAIGDSCWSPRRFGNKSDSGFGQLISLWYKGKKSPLCKLHGVCSQWGIIASPWSSILALVWALEMDGSHPWCYSKQARRYHACSLAPDR